MHDLVRNFGRRRALASVSLTCEAGRITGVLGPNGAGKSTLLSILSTLLAPSSGDVRYGTKTAGEMGASLRARIGLLAHDLYLYPELTARENLLFFGRLHGLREPAGLVDAALERAGLGRRGNDLVGSFSRGMRQRLALERALLHAPRLVLLDEPFTGLDEAAVSSLIDRLGALRSHGSIVIVTTHDLDVAERLLDDTVFLRDGRLRVPAGGETLRDRYRATIHAAS